VQSIDRTARTWIRLAEESSRGLSQALAGAVGRAESAADQRKATVVESTDVLARVDFVRRSLLGP
jgi:hypothetical protein